MNVKRAAAQFPKQALLASLKKGGNTKFMKVSTLDPEDGTVYASAHMDKAPMALVHTAGSIGPGKPRQRNWAKFLLGKMVARKYML